MASNGALPASDLADLPNGHRLRTDAADALSRLDAAMQHAGQGGLMLSNGKAGYRTLIDQRYMIRMGWTTMPAGKSEHGWGLAADFADLGGFAGARHRWLCKYGPAYGWSQPAWATKYGPLPEPWHWEYNPAHDRRKDANMLSDADKKWITARIVASLNHRVHPVVDKGKKITMRRAVARLLILTRRTEAKVDALAKEVSK